MINIQWPADYLLVGLVLLWFGSVVHALSSRRFGVALLIGLFPPAVAAYLVSGVFEIGFARAKR